MASMFDSLYGKKNLFDVLYSRQGADSPIRRTDVRLGDSDLSTTKPFFERDFAGIPVWLIGVFIMGYSYMSRRKRVAKTKKSRRR